MTVQVARGLVIVLIVAALSAAASAQPPPPRPGDARTAEAALEPQAGQADEPMAGAPTPPELVEKMLDLARVTGDDFVVDLRSGDGRHVIAAALRGARGLGVDPSQDMVALSRKLAVDAEVDDFVSFVQGDMYEADISQATVMTLFLPPGDLESLQDKLLALKPGSRIVVGTVAIPGWQPDAVYELPEGCPHRCAAFLHIAPAVVAGAWRLDDDSEMTISQTFQMVQGVLGRTRDRIYGRLNGDQIAFTAGKATYTGVVDDDRINGTVTEPGSSPRPWSALQLR